MLRPFAITTLMLLAGCAPEVIAPPTLSPVASPRPQAPSPRTSVESEALRAYYAQVEARLLAQGLLRTDGGGPDTPFSVRDLTENFIRIALYDEYARVGGRLIARQTPSRLRRWDQPVRIGVEFGGSVPPAQRAMDQREITAYAARLSRVMGHPVSVGGSPNFHVLILNEDERRAAGPHLERLIPGIDPLTLRTITEMPRSAFCLVFAFSRGGADTYAAAVAVIRGEHPDLLRQSCIHEEIAQGMGLANDSATARPTIFNDSEEFATLTGHDELLLRILYDPRLRPGMTEDEARPIVTRIATELLGGDS
jgi:hypothetical protein